ncbi:MAG: DUF973 family protein [Metallosphaera sp.]
MEPSEEIKALNTLKLSALIGIVYSVIDIIELIIFLYTGIFTISTQLSGLTFLSSPYVFALGAVSAIIVIAQVFLSWRGFRILRRLDIAKEGYTGSKMLLIASIIDFIVIYPFLEFYLIPKVLPILKQIQATNPDAVRLSSSALSSLLPLIASYFVLILIVGILGIVGLVLIVIQEFKLGSRYEEGSLKLGSILQIIPIVNLAAFVLLYVGFSSSMRKVGSSLPPVLAYQVGLGSLSPEGIAQFSLFSVRTIKITKLKLKVKDNVIENSKVIELNQGENRIVTDFGPLELQKGSYTLELTLENGEEVKVYLIY